MRRSATVFCILLLVVAGIAGCTSMPFSGTPAPTQTPQKEGGGPAPASGLNQAALKPTATEHLDLKSALDRFSGSMVISSEGISPANEYAPANASLAPDAVSEIKVLAIHSRSIDENGTATSWSFILGQGDRTFLVTESGRGEVVSDVQFAPKLSVIDPTKILMPRDLIQKNHDVIFNTSRTGPAVTRDISIEGGKTTLTITGTGGAPRILVFDATTGVLKSSND